MRKFVWFLAAAVGIAGATPAVAQSVAPFPPFEVVTIARSMGLQVIGPPLRRGPLYVMRAIDPYGEEMRVTFDARVGEIISAIPMANLPGRRAPRDEFYALRYSTPYGASPPPDFEEDEENVQDVAPVPLQPPRDVKPRAVAIAPAPAKVPDKLPIPRPKPRAISMPFPANAAEPVPAKPAEKPAAKPLADMPVNPLF